jgi:hypothetical protein
MTCRIQSQTLSDDVPYCSLMRLQLSESLGIAYGYYSVLRVSPKALHRKLIFISKWYYIAILLEYVWKNSILKSFKLEIKIV